MNLTKILRWLFGVQHQDFNSGVIEDTTIAGVSFEEIVKNPNPVKWIEKQVYKTYPPFNQSNSFSCVAQSLAKMVGIYYQQKYGKYIPFSPAFIYKRRVNRPNAGMIAYDAFNIAKEHGVNLYDLEPSNGMNDAQIDLLKEEKHFKDIASVFKIGERIEPSINIDTIASILNTTGKGVMLWFSFSYYEWSEVPTIQVNNPNLRHSVVAVDFTLYNGKKAIIVDDSWGVPKKIITEDFFKRCFYAGYFMNFKFEQGDKPIFDGTVKSLQDCLKYLGYFPSNVESTGVFGELTKQALIKFQQANGLNAEGVFGEITKNKLKELF